MLNPHNNQYSITLPKKKINFPKGKIPFEIDFEIKGVRYYIK